MELTLCTEHCQAITGFGPLCSSEGKFYCHGIQSHPNTDVCFQEFEEPPHMDVMVRSIYKSTHMVYRLCLPDTRGSECVSHQYATQQHAKYRRSPVMTCEWAGLPVNTRASHCPRAHIYTQILGFGLQDLKLVTMRFLYSLTLSTLIVVYLLSDNVLGDKMKGRYAWLRCQPDSKNANCIKNLGPLLELPGPPRRLPARVARDLHPVETSEETEESGDGSGDFSQYLTLNRHERSVNEVPQQILHEEEGSGPDYVPPESVKPKLSAEDLREDNMIE